MGDLKEKILYYLSIYKKQIIIGVFIGLFLISSILIYYFSFGRNKNNSVDNNSFIQEVVKEESNDKDIKKSDVVIENKEETIVNDKEIVIKKVIVDIKGEVKKPGVYEIEENKRINDVVKMAGGLTSKASTLVNNLSRKVKDEMVIIIYSKDEINDFKKKKEEENTIIDEFTDQFDTIINNSVIDKNDIDSNTNIEINNDNESNIDNKNENISNDTNNDNNSENNDNNDNSNDTNNKNNDIDLVKISINKANKDELMKIDGIGEKKALDIIEYRNSNGEFKKLEDIMNVSGIGETTFNKIKDKISL